MKKQKADYEFETEYWADLPMFKVILFAVAIVILIGAFWLLKLFERTLQIRP